MVVQIGLSFVTILLEAHEVTICTIGVQVKCSRPLSHPIKLWIYESILEPEIKEQIHAANYKLELGLADMGRDAEEIARAIEEMQGNWLINTRHY